jgi:hypothetical protein
MMDPTGGGVGKAGAELLKEMQQAQEELQKMDQKGPDQAGSFQDTLQAQQTQGPQAANQIQQVEATTKSSNVLMNAKVNSMTPTTKVGATARSQRSQMASMIEGLVNGQDKMTQIMDLAMSNKKMSPQELLAMQAGVYRFSQELELTSKVVEKATSGIKQTMNTQV